MENTEQKILKSAAKIFQTKGYAGTRMQEIADDAGINKAALHYYFRSKEKLFQRVFKETFESVFPNIGESFFLQKSIFDKLRIFIELYIDFLYENIKLLSFVICEIQTNPATISDILERHKSTFSPQMFAESINDAIEKGEIRQIDPKHLFINIISLCVFPFLSKDVYTKIYKMNEKDLELFLSERKKEIYEFIKFSIQKES